MTSCPSTQQITLGHASTVRGTFPTVSAGCQAYSKPRPQSQCWINLPALPGTPGFLTPGRKEHYSLPTPAPTSRDSSLGHS